MNEKALKELLNAAKRIAKDPWYDWSTNPDEWSCRFCGTMYSRLDEAEIEDESTHSEHCLWRRLKEALANLDNEGY
jgi:hypothetical protein